jgi:hypothetical protein
LRKVIEMKVSTNFKVFSFGPLVGGEFASDLMTKTIENWSSQFKRSDGFEVEEQTVNVVMTPENRIFVTIVIRYALA